MRRWQIFFLVCVSLFPLFTGSLTAQAPSDARVKSMSTSLRLRQTPSPVGEVILELAGGTSLSVLGRTIDDNWLNVQTAEGQAGWVASGYVELFIALNTVPVMTADGGTITTPTTTTDPAAPAQTVAEPASGGAAVKRGITLRLRADASTAAAVLADLRGGTPLEVIGRSADGAWLNVTANGQTGWVAALYVESVSVAVGTTTGATSEAAVTVRGVSAIYQRGRALGNNYGRFAKVGDSITVSEYSYDAIGRGQYNLGGYGNLQYVINTFTASGFNSFTNVSAAAKGGWTTDNLLYPGSRDTNLCPAETTPLECELDRIKPSIALIELGTNDILYVAPEQFDFNLNRIIDICIGRGVIPVLTTIPHREGYDGNVDTYSNIIRDVAARRDVPLWDLRASLDNLPYRGLSGDGIHPSFPPGGYADSANFANPEAMQTGYVIRNLTALQVLERVLAAMGG